MNRKSNFGQSDQQILKQQFDLKECSRKMSEYFFPQKKLQRNEIIQIHYCLWNIFIVLYLLTMNKIKMDKKQNKRNNLFERNSIFVRYSRSTWCLTYLQIERPKSHQHQHNSFRNKEKTKKICCYFDRMFSKWSNHRFINDKMHFGENLQTNKSRNKHFTLFSTKFCSRDKFMCSYYVV